MAVVLSLLGSMPAWLGCGSSGTEQTGNEPPAGGSEVISDGGSDINSDEGLSEGIDAPVAVVTGGSQRRTTKRIELMDPRNDGWTTEAVAEQVTDQLKKVSNYLKHPTDTGNHDLRSIAADNFSSRSLWPTDMVSVFQNGTFEVRQPVKQTDLNGKAGTPTYQGGSGFAQAVANATLNQETAEDLHAKFKVFRVEFKKTGTLTEAYYEASASTKDGVYQQNATWLCRWTTPDGDAPLRLISVEVKDYQDVLYAPGTRGPLLADCTEAVFAKEPCFSDQLQQSIYHWAGRMERHLGSDNRALQGLAIGDVNGDGRDDVYLCQSKGLPNRLLVQNADGTVRDMASTAGVDWLDSTTSALLLDIDHDGDQDLVLASQAGLMFLSNDGRGVFHLEARFSGGKSDSVSAADFDQDGDLDFYVSRYSNEEGSSNIFPVPVPYHDANNGPANVLYRNDGNWNFIDVTADVGLNQNNRRFSWAASWEDLDDDGDPDLYVANDFGRNNFYRNDDGRFTDMAGSAGLEDRSTGMATTFGDYDRDGQMDVYVSNMWSSAGNRITYQNQFKSSADDRTKNHFQYLARGNSLFKNRGDGTFQDVSIEAGATMGRWSWASLFCDLDNDGWQDLLVANGMITGQRPGDL